MPISNYSDLQTAVGDWLNRADLSARIPDFIALAEADIRRDVRARKVVEATLTAADVIPLPGDAVQVVSLRVLRPGRSNAIPQVTLDEMWEIRDRYADSTGMPSVYAIANGNVYLAPRPDAAYDVRVTYYQAIPALAVTPTNYLLTRAPDLYLYGALIHSAPFLQEPERIAEWRSFYDRAVFAVNRDFEREELGSNNRRASLGVVF